MFQVANPWTKRSVLQSELEEASTDEKGNLFKKGGKKTKTSADSTVGNGRIDTPGRRLVVCRFLELRPLGRCIGVFRVAGVATAESCPDGFLLLRFVPRARDVVAFYFPAAPCCTGRVVAQLASGCFILGVGPAFALGSKRAWGLGLAEDRPELVRCAWNVWKNSGGLSANATSVHTLNPRIH